MHSRICRFSEDNILDDKQMANVRMVYVCLLCLCICFQCNADLRRMRSVGQGRNAFAHQLNPQRIGGIVGAGMLKYCKREMAKDLFSLRELPFPSHLG